MHYHDSSSDGSLRSVWYQIVNTIVVSCPSLFGCSRVTLEKVASKRELDNLIAGLEKLGAKKVAEAHDDGKGIVHLYFRMDKKPIVVIVEKDKPVQIIAPKSLIEQAEDEMKIILP